MKKLKDFLLRGLIFGGFGPIVFGIIYLFISLDEVTPFTGIDIFCAILSTYLLAFIHAGASVFNQIEEWSLAKSTGVHFLTLYVIYIVCYLINRWIPFNWAVIGIFTGIFAGLYLIIWLIVYLIVKKTTKQMNIKLNK